MKISIKTFKTLAIILCLSFVSNAQTNWVGEYFFGEDGGETVGGTKIYIAHTIKITEKDGKLDAHIYSQGFQTSKDIYADVKTEGNKIMLYYREKGEDQYTGEYKTGDLLLTLEWKEIAGKKKLFTYWNKFTPSLDANGKSADTYFKQIQKNQKEPKETKWMRVNSEDKEISVALPSDSIIDAERKVKNLKTHIQGFSDGVKMQLISYSSIISRKSITMFPNRSSTKIRDFNVEDFFIRILLGNDLNAKYSQTFIIVSDKHNYRLKVSADSNEKEAVSKFLLSIKIKGKAIFSNSNASNKLPTVEKTVYINNFRSSPVVIESYNKKLKSPRGKIKLQNVAISNSYEINQRKYSRMAMILNKPNPKFVSDRKIPDGFIEVVLKVQLLATGQIGDIIILSSPNKSYAQKCCIKVMKKMRFVPAQINGKNVESFHIVTYPYIRFSFSR